MAFHVNNSFSQKFQSVKRINDHRGGILLSSRKGLCSEIYIGIELDNMGLIHLKILFQLIDIPIAVFIVDFIIFAIHFVHSDPMLDMKPYSRTLSPHWHINALYLLS